jgi:hypothetical protein
MTKVFLYSIKVGGILFLFLFQPEYLAGTENNPAGARSLALSHASVSFSDAWATFHNQAGLAGAAHFSAAVFFESRFGIDELSLAAGSLILPARQGAFGLSMYQFGKGSFSNNKYGLAYAYRLSEKWSAGLQLDYFTQRLPENGQTKGFATFEGGLLFIPDGKLHLGAHVFNPVSGGFEIPSGKVEMPMIIRAGGHYAFDDTVLIAFEAEKTSRHPLVIKSGVEFIPAENFAVRIGVSGKPLKYTAGFGYSTAPVSVDLGFAYHGNLGITPSISVQFGL